MLNSVDEFFVNLKIERSGKDAKAFATKCACTHIDILFDHFVQVRFFCCLKKSSCIWVVLLFCSEVKSPMRDEGRPDDNIGGLSAFLDSSVNFVVKSANAEVDIWGTRIGSTLERDWDSRSGP